MIHWLTQTLAEIPADDYLTDAELARLQELKTDKRRADWLLGRWTAKRLLQTVIWETDGVTLPLDMITITNSPDGVPDYQLPMPDAGLRTSDFGLRITDHGSRITDYGSPFTVHEVVAQRHHRFSISISHAHGRAFVAAIERAHAPIGADMELIQPRPAGFAEEYFTLAEIALGYGLIGQERAVWETAVWSAKEAVLKALHLGLSVDTRAISCLIEPVAHPPGIWTPFAIRCDHGRLPQPAPPLTGWWRVQDGFVLTIATG